MTKISAKNKFKMAENDIRRTKIRPEGPLDPKNQHVKILWSHLKKFMKKKSKKTSIPFSFLEGGRMTRIWNEQTWRDC